MKFRSLILAVLLALPLASSHAQVDISVGWAPPPLPVYEQPPVPGPGYIWTPGYWAWGDWDYYWVPGVWVAPPSVGLLWTPPWWGWRNGVYVFNQGFWGPTVGFYGGINYGYGYTGNGFWGGQWRGNNFYYNTAVTRVNTNIVHNTYVNNSFTKNVNVNRASFNGPNGVKAEPTAEQKAAAANKKQGPTSQQLAFKQAATKDQNLRASANKGNPSADAINSFKKGQGKGEQALGAAGGPAGAAGGAGQGKGAQGPGAAGAAGPGAGKGENKPGNLSERQGQGAAAGAGKPGSKPGNVTERNRQGAGAGQGAGKGKTGANANKGKMGGNQPTAHPGKRGAGAGAGGPPPRTMNQMNRNPQMGARNAQMGGGKHPQMGGRPPQMGGGKRPPPQGQPQGKKKPNRP